MGGKIGGLVFNGWREGIPLLESSHQDRQSQLRCHLRRASSTGRHTGRGFHHHWSRGLLAASQQVEEEPAVSSISDHLVQEEILQTAASNLRGETSQLEQVQATAGFPGDPIAQPSVVPAVQLSAEKEERETEPKLRWFLRGRVPVKEWPVKVARILSYADEIPIPSGYRKAMCSPDKDKWNVAIQEELQSLINNGTWSVVTCPEEAKAIGSKWVYDIKPGMNDEPIRYKAHLVAKGYSQRPGQDFGETHASVVTYNAFRMLMSTITAKDLEAKQVHIKTAFLNGRLEEEIYLQQPEDFAIPGQEDKVLRLHKCIYGLRQASHVWEKLVHRLP